VFLLCLSCFGWTKLGYPKASYELRSDILVFVFRGVFSSFPFLLHYYRCRKGEGTYKRMKQTVALIGQFWETFDSRGIWFPGHFWPDQPVAHRTRILPAPVHLARKKSM